MREITPLPYARKRVNFGVFPYFAPGVDWLHLGLPLQTFHHSEMNPELFSLQSTPIFSSGPSSSNGLVRVSNSSSQRFPYVMEFKRREHSNGTGELLRTRRIRCKHILVAVGLGVLKVTRSGFTAPTGRKSPPPSEFSLLQNRFVPLGVTLVLSIRCSSGLGT